MEYLKMSFLIMLFILFFSSLISTTHCVGGEKNFGKTNLSKEGDDTEIERQLRVLNKKPVKTIITEIGDVIDCIDIYKQPAFDNPLLKDHKIQVSPKLSLGETKGKNTSAPSIFHGLQRERCPSGTIPIRRMTKEKLVNAKFLAKKFEPINANGFPNAIYHSVYAAEVIRGKKYFGGAASMSIHSLTVDPDQFSNSQIWIESTTRDETNNIQFGITKNPIIVGGHLPRLFGLWMVSDGHHNAGCYNIACPGFIQTHDSIFIDQPFVHSSVYGQIVYDVHIMVHRDQDGHWWLRMGPTAETSENVGYWPNEIFTTLKTNASGVRYGGFVGSMNQAETPPMGNGFFPQFQDINTNTTAAYMSLMKYVNEEGASVDLNPNLVQTMLGTVPQCYKIIFASLMAEDWRNNILYGGPGGYCN